MTEYIISDRCGTSATILPEKGATVVSLKKQGIEYLYRDDENLLSDERPRCGIPFLFPIFGRLKDGPMSGTARAMPWKSTALPTQATGRFFPIRRIPFSCSWSPTRIPAPSTPLNFV